MPAPFAYIADAQTQGIVSAGQAKVIIAAVDHLPESIAAEHGQWLEQTLVSEAARLNPISLRGFANVIIDALDPDGTERDDREEQRRRRLTLVSRPDGSGDLTGRLTAAATAALQLAFDSLAAPRPEADGLRDDRSPAQRRHERYSSSSWPPPGPSSCRRLVGCR